MLRAELPFFIGSTYVLQLRLKFKFALADESLTVHHTPGIRLWTFPVTNLRFLSTKNIFSLHKLQTPPRYLLYNSLVYCLKEGRCGREQFIVVSRLHNHTLHQQIGGKLFLVRENNWSIKLDLGKSRLDLL